MIRKITLLLLLVMGWIGAVQAYENTYAVIVGVADYKNLKPDKGDLKFTINDVNAFNEFLKSKKGGSVPASNIVVLTNAQASKQNIIDKAKALFAKAKKNDRVIFFFSGHGNKGYFMPYDAGDIGDRLLYFDEIKSIFRCAKCNTKLLFADACQSGSMKTNLATKKELKNNMDKGKKAADNMNIAVMMSCSDGEMSVESSAWNQGLFTFCLMEGLGGKANRDGNRYITIQELFHYVYHRVHDTNPNQTPQLFGKFDLRLIVSKLY